MFHGAYRLQQAARINATPLKPCSGGMKLQQGLLCQHDFDEILAPDNPHPLIDPARIHKFWHLRQQKDLQAEARTVAKEWVDVTHTVGTFFTHYPEGDIEILPPLQAEDVFLPRNDYFDSNDGEIREMSPDAAIIQEPLSRPQFVRSQAKAKAKGQKKRDYGQLRNGLGPTEDIVANLTASGRLETGNETVNRRLDAEEQIAKKAARKCGHCRVVGHTIKTCGLYKKSQAADILEARSTQASNSSRNPPPSGVQQGIASNPTRGPFHLTAPQYGSQSHTYLPLPTSTPVFPGMPFSSFHPREIPSQHFFNYIPEASSSRIAPASQGSYYNHPM